MSREIVLAVQDLGKCFRRYARDWQRLGVLCGVPFPPIDETWILRNINFSVPAGEGVGIIGQNGAGKSTLLKLITGTLRPTSGRVHMAGRVSAILELGMGFNPELTARDNVFHAGGLLGYETGQLAELMPKIAAFAEIGDYFDQPMRTFSSGMQMRVAFALATAVRPDLLIVDEALSVGDSYFQHKCFSRIRQFIEDGTSLLFVSHSLGDVRALCNHAILLEGGGIAKEGMPDEVIDYYNALIANKENAKLSLDQRRTKDGWLLTRSGTGEATVEDISMHDAETGAEIKLANVGQRLAVRVRVAVHSLIPRLVIGFLLRDKKGAEIWGTNTWHTKQILHDIEPGRKIEFTLDFVNSLGPGSYSVSTALVSTDTHLVDNYEWIDNLLVFDVANLDKMFFIGCNALDATIKSHTLPDERISR